jgi:hypothetical protein
MERNSAIKKITAAMFGGKGDTECYEIIEQFAQQRALDFSKYIQNIPLFYNTEKQAYQNIFGEQHFTEHELYLDFLTTLKQ